MPKSPRPVRRRRVTPASRATVDSETVRSCAPAQLAVPTTRALLERILDVPQLARIVPHLQPEVLHRVIQTCGLEDCGELVALATPTQLAGVYSTSTCGAPISQAWTSSSTPIARRVARGAAWSLASRLPHESSRRWIPVWSWLPWRSTCWSSTWRHFHLLCRPTERSSKWIPRWTPGSAPRNRRVPRRRETVRIVGRHCRRAARPRRGASGRLRPRDARVSGSVELRARSGWVGQSARRWRAGHVRPWNRSRTAPREERLCDACRSARVPSDVRGLSLRHDAAPTDNPIAARTSEVSISPAESTRTRTPDACRPAPPSRLRRRTPPMP